MKETRKKVRVIGKQEYINHNTGELNTFDVVESEERDYYFHKVWMKPFTKSILSFCDNKTKVALWIMNNINLENQLVYSQRQIAQMVGVSIQTVNTTMKAMIDSNLIRKFGSGYLINPNIIFKGKKEARDYVGYMYRDAGKNVEKRKDFR